MYIQMHLYSLKHGSHINIVVSLKTSVEHNFNT